MPLSAGVAYIDVLPNMSKFAPAVQGEAAATSGALSKLGKTGALAVGAIGAASVALGADFEKSMRNVNSLAQLPEPAFDRLNDQVLALAGPTAQAPKTLAEGMYDLVSSGFDAKESLSILKSSALAATAGLTTTETSTKAVAAVLNAYRLPASKAKEVSDVLFRTVDRGVISFETLAGSIGNALPAASALGVDMKPLGAAVATLTKQGQSGETAIVNINAAMTSLFKPTEAMKGALKELGYENAEALVKAEGFQGGLQSLVETTDGTTASVGELFANVRAQRAVFGLTGKNAEGAAKDLRSMEDAAGATQKAFEEQSKSLSVQWQRLKANLSVIAIRIGSVLIPAISDAVRWLNEDFGQALRDVTGWVSRLATAVVGRLVGAFRAAANWVRTAIRNVRGFIDAILSTKPAALILAGILRILKTAWSGVKATARIAFAAMKGGLRIVGAAVEAVWEVVKGLGRVIGDVIGIATNLLRGDFAGAWENVKDLVRSVAGVIKTVLTGAFNVVKAVLRSVKDVGREVFNALAGFVRALMAPIDAVIDKLGDLLGLLGDAISKVVDLADKAASLPGKALDLLPSLATGGPVTAGQTYLVGEEGPELFRPRTAGRIIPNNELLGRGTPRMVAGAARSRRSELTITNWEKGTGYMRDVASGEVYETRIFDRQRRRMGG